MGSLAMCEYLFILRVISEESILCVMHPKKTEGTQTSKYTNRNNKVNFMIFYSKSAVEMPRILCIKFGEKKSLKPFTRYE